MPDLAPLHPRPQLTRERWTDLNGAWGFAFDDANVGLRERWWDRPEVFDRQIVVPFPPESRASGLHEPGFHPVVWYRRTFGVTPGDRAARLLLHFGAVDYRASVWVNGQLVAQHEGGHTPFTAEITGALIGSGQGEQVVVVRAEDDPRDLAQPRGKQDWHAEPHAIWYHRTTGIWQSVWLEPVPDTGIGALRWTPDLDRASLLLQLRLDGELPQALTLRTELTLRGERLALSTCEVTGREVRAVFPLDPARLTVDYSGILWSPRHPNLIGARLTLLRGDVVVDEVGSYAGMRSVAVQGGRFLLNTLPVSLRLVLAQNYWPESHLAAPSADALRREVELVRELGFNGVRVHQKIEDPRFLYWCDVLGLLVWGEMPSALTFSAGMQTRLSAEWMEAVTRDASHPCVVAWVPLNESWGVPNLERDPAQRDFVKALYHLTRSLDPTRPVIANDGWQFVAGDVLGIHDYAPSGETLRARYGTAQALERTFASVQPYFRNLLVGGFQRGEEAVVLSEFGGLSLAPEAGEKWFGYGTGASAGELLAQYEDLVGAVLDSEVLAGFCYTQLTDTEQETNGLLTAGREFKFDPARVRAANTRPARAVPGELLYDQHLAAEAAPGPAALEPAAALDAAALGTATLGSAVPVTPIPDDERTP